MAPSWWGCLCDCVLLAKILLSESFLFPPRTDLGVKLLHISCHLHTKLFSCSLWCIRHVHRYITRVLGRLTRQNFDSPTGRLRRQNPPKRQVQNL